MWKDGHLVYSDQHYLRTRSPKSPKPHIYIYNTRWAIAGAEEDYNDEGKTIFGVVRDVYHLENK